MKTKQICRWLPLRCQLAPRLRRPRISQCPHPPPAQSLAEPVVGVADPDALFHSKDPKLDRNMQAAYHIMKELLECNQWSDAGNWLTDKYIQHNPMAKSGPAGRDRFLHQRAQGQADQPVSRRSCRRPRSWPCWPAAITSPW